MELKDRLRELRGNKTQAQITGDLNETAQELGYSKIKLENYNKWENGSSPNYNTLCLIADYYNTSIDYLIGRSNVKNLDFTSLNITLGLTDDCIETIKGFNMNYNSSYKNSLIVTFNNLICNDKFPNLLFNIDLLTNKSTITKNYVNKVTHRLYGNIDFDEYKKYTGKALNLEEMGKDVILRSIRGDFNKILNDLKQK